MATYPGMSLRGEVRESISLDEDDLSDVEDEVFIRDGKNGYKLAEEINVKRPLMAPRRKIGKPDITSRLKSKPPCKAFCKPCCYVFAALSVLIGLIILVVILVSIFPLPLDRLRDWVISKSKNPEPAIKISPCNNLKITDVWTVNLPKLTTDSPVRLLDVNGDDYEDILFGFGTGDGYDYDVVPPDIFCPIIMGVPPPCKGGIIALNGLNGDIIWRHWLNDTIFNLDCTRDVNDDGIVDCLAIGMEGTIAVINSRNGSTIWKLNTGKLNVFVGSFVPDQNKDNVSDVLAAHSPLVGKDSHIILFSGANGQELNRKTTKHGAKTFYMPQLLNNSETFVLFGTGGPNAPGNLSATPLTKLFLNTSEDVTKTLYQDKFKGILTQSVLVDITGDKIPDVITAMYNSTVVAIDGSTFEEIWNFTVPGSKAETDIVPTPGYFNFDNVTDFLVVYQKYDNILNNNYTQTFILDGKSGLSIYEPIIGSVTSQMSGLTLSMESHGYDMFLFWTSECTNVELYKKTEMPKKENFSFATDECRRQFNTSSLLKLNALNQFHQPPGLLVYNSANRSSTEFNNTKSPMKQLKEYFQNHPKSNIADPGGQSEIGEKYNVQGPIVNRKYGSSSFRHKDHKNPGFIKDLMGESPENNLVPLEGDSSNPAKYNIEYDWQNQPSNMLNEIPEDIDQEFNNYLDETDTIPYNQKQLYLEPINKNNRDPRSKENTETSSTDVKTKKKNLSATRNGIYGYKNIQLAKTRLLHDVNNLPSDILRDTFFKNEERRLRKSKFEQRDINSHNDKLKDNVEVRKVIEEEKKMVEHNASTNLWDLESEKEMQDKENGNWRGKRDVNYTFDSVTKITSVGAVLDSINGTNNGTNSIDIVFVTYWLPLKKSQRDILQDEIEECIEDKMTKSSEDDAHAYQKTTATEQRALFKRECVEEQRNLKRDFSFFSQISQLKLGQMTVYRLRLECLCESLNPNERCAQFLPKTYQSWPGYLGRFGNGIFQTRG